MLYLLSRAHCASLIVPMLRGPRVWVLEAADRGTAASTLFYLVSVAATYP